MATRNGADIVDSKVTVQKNENGTYRVVSTITVLEYDHCSSDFAKFLASELRDKGVTYPKPEDAISEDDVCHTDHSNDSVYETDAGTWRVTRHRKIHTYRSEAFQVLDSLRKQDKLFA